MFLQPWLYGLKVIAITLAVIMFISGLDDFFIDVVYWVRRIKRQVECLSPLPANELPRTV
ncbi:bacteriophage N4 adsorption protein B [Escherichia coli]|uniref:Bacteriophage N4 adsorption protein B n=1 Tax=Escherichia coli TaxID=562 RepID=A0A376KYS6_ECOLX|nr:bacteriophage N4 adsorption protein B [Escherichia coli]